MKLRSVIVLLSSDPSRSLRMLAPAETTASVVLVEVVLGMVPVVVVPVVPKPQPASVSVAQRAKV